MSWVSGVGLFDSVGFFIAQPCSDTRMVQISIIPRSLSYVVSLDCLVFIRALQFFPPMSTIFVTFCSEFHLVVYCLLSVSPEVPLQFFTAEPCLYYSSFTIIRIHQLIANDFPRGAMDTPNERGPHSGIRG